MSSQIRGGEFDIGERRHGRGGNPFAIQGLVMNRHIGDDALRRLDDALFGITGRHQVSGISEALITVKIHTRAKFAEGQGKVMPTTKANAKRVLDIEFNGWLIGRRLDPQRGMSDRD